MTKLYVYPCFDFQLGSKEEGYYKLILPLLAVTHTHNDLLWGGKFKNHKEAFEKLENRKALEELFESYEVTTYIPVGKNEKERKKSMKKHYQQEAELYPFSVVELIKLEQKITLLKGKHVIVDF